MTTLTIEMPDGLFVTLRRSPQEVQQEVRLAAAIDWYRRGLVSQGRAAEIAGLARADFIDSLSERKVDVIQVNIEDLRQELEFA